MRWLRQSSSLIESSNNGGYAAGNNLGLRELIADGSCDHVLIANPDTRIDEYVIRELSDILVNHDDCAICGCQQVNPISSTAFRSYWDLPTFAYDLRALFFLGRRLNHKMHSDHTYDYDGTSCCVGAVSGALFLADLGKLNQIGLFDEGTFLYCEETILGKRCAMHNLKVRFSPLLAYYHYHATSTSKTLGIARSMDVLHRSMLYYHQHYESLSPIKSLLFRACMPVSRFEFQLMALASTWLKRFPLESHLGRVNFG